MTYNYILGHCFLKTRPFRIRRDVKCSVTTRKITKAKQSKFISDSAKYNTFGLYNIQQYDKSVQYQNKITVIKQN